VIHSGVGLHHSVPEFIKQFWSASDLRIYELSQQNIRAIWLKCGECIHTNNLFQQLLREVIKLNERCQGWTKIA